MNISAVIPTKNRIDDLISAVESVITQIRQPDELIIIDQSDSQDGVDAIQRLVEASSLTFKLLHVYDTSVAGLVHAKDRGVQESSGDIVAFLEDDIVLREDYFQQLEKGFVDKPSMYGCSGIAEKVASFTPMYRFLFSLFHTGLFEDKRMNVCGRGDLQAKDMIQSHFLSGGISAYRREVFAEVKFDMMNDVFMYEDIDFSVRAVKKFGKQNFYINPSMVLDHRASPINRYRSTERWTRKIRELLCFYKKNRRSSADIFSLLWLLVGMFIESLVSSVKMKQVGPFTGFFKGFCAGIKYKIKGTW